MDLSIKEKIYGAIFGYAIGDALGLGTEFMSISEVSRRYPDGLSDYSQIIRDAHRSQWKRGEWSNDTEIVLIILKSFLKCKGFNYLDIASQLKKWYESQPTDLTHNMRLVLKQKDYTIRPFESAEEAWRKVSTFENSSECLGRSVFSFLSYYPLDSAADLCRLTHPGSRTISCCRVIATMAESLMRDGRPASYDEIKSICLDSKDDVGRFIEIAHNGNIEDFDLDDEDSYWFVRKATGAALWCVWHNESFQHGIQSIISQGGDADTNAALAGALVGMQRGYSAIPAPLLEGLLGKERLYTIADEILAFIESKSNQE
ncbi:MAG: ADP-ribosylglycohydrolase family protein [Muribaculaceae bacterium]|nr:ADP-ribosylglycohydrolase family protein [Muribaculaceae bacterium]